MGDCDYDEFRRRENERSMQWATRQKQQWSPEDDTVILNEWVLVHPKDRDEMGIAERLARSLFACQGRAEHLRGVLDFKGEAAARPAQRDFGICDRCFIALPATGVCDNCD